jgi:hypothetical protein
MNILKLDIPSHFDSEKVDKVWRVDYQNIAEDASKLAEQFNISPSANDKTKVALVLIDLQNTFCIPEFELFVGGRSGKGAFEDNVRLCEFIYGNLNVITMMKENIRHLTL